MTGCEAPELGGGGDVSEERSVSWMPGAEGAPLEVAEEVFVVEEEWLDGGAIRSDCRWKLSKRSLHDRAGSKTDHLGF